ncbi:MAG: aldo/keto reductase [Desulfobacterales bacterium]|nr:aldo/keto reductase [Desulfobacterales bacterium]MDX2511199.1 aldo/keto reductase [Desulfobacterales bacterium]
MSDKKGNLSRRDFIKTAGAVSLGSSLFPLNASAQTSGSTSAMNSEPMIMPTRPFGETGVDVSILSLGGVLGMSDQLMFRQAIKMGVTYWDTADSYGWGKSEKAIGKYFSRFPDDRKKVFLVTKSSSSDPETLTDKLNESLKRMHTSTIDLYLIHHVGDVKDRLTDGVKVWAEKTKAQGKIRLFGFSTHTNMENNMLAAAELGWVDGIMMSYNYRLMVKKDMKRAVEACVKAGIGLTAMKTQASFSANFYASIGSETDEAEKMTDKLLEKGYTAEQARLRAVWESPHIASICSAMPNMTILQANVAAALNKINLSAGDKQRLDLYARQTAPAYCAGCADICESCVDTDIPISDIMRNLMYENAYGKQELSVGYLKKIAPAVARQILVTDFSKAEHRCPQNMPIKKLMRKASEKFA